MIHIRTILQKIFKKELPKPVGRWKIENCNTKINSKIDLSNEDHCGPCGQYALSKIEFKNRENKNNQNKDSNLEKSK